MVSALFVNSILIASTVKFKVQEFHKLAARLSLNIYPAGLIGAWVVFLIPYQMGNLFLFTYQRKPVVAKS